MTYGVGARGLDVLRGVSLAVQAGQTVAICGPSGSGKSTLLHLLGALDAPTAGSILFRGRDLATLTRAELADFRSRSLGFVFQFHHLLPQFSVLENVLLPALASAQKTPDLVPRALGLLGRLKLLDRQDHRPAELSGGERQRVAVARALINRPALLLADEPTGALDQAHASSLTDTLLEMQQSEGSALVVVTHSQDVARRMQCVYDLRDGVLSKANA
jgi:lipoprotein-releasing system ATP-binding protein